MSLRRIYTRIIRTFRSITDLNLAGPHAEMSIQNLPKITKEDSQLILVMFIENIDEHHCVTIFSIHYIIL